VGDSVGSDERAKLGVCDGLSVKMGGSVGPLDGIALSSLALGSNVGDSFSMKGVGSAEGLVVVTAFVGTKDGSIDRVGRSDCEGTGEERPSNACFHRYIWMSPVVVIHMMRVSTHRRASFLTLP